MTPDQIVQQKDPTTGKTFYTNRATGKKGWSKEEVETVEDGDEHDDGDEDDDVVTAAVERLSLNLFGCGIGETGARAIAERVPAGLRRGLGYD